MCNKYVCTTYAHKHELDLQTLLPHVINMYN